MYYYIRGKLTKKTPTFGVLDVQGVGYEIRWPLSAFSSVNEGEEYTLFTYLYVKEDVQQLFGFISENDRSLFLLLISISGIGPSTGIAFLSSLSSSEICSAIMYEDVKTVQSVKGVGAKTAQRVVIELKDKISKLQYSGELQQSATPAMAQDSAVTEEAMDALVALGFTRAGAQKSIKLITKKHGNDLTVEKLIKLALKQN
ncbi:Holliday junction branch migration protein RuvA [Flammeovirga kamogawensis]|uniref:Holliday junction branch migration complex subunit RuvA n=1 Tax=Flammeovirga kamogawensis TaxID=373891 RepID=A0ABX8GVC7_9BACT|nr:Holliday junction branch migration protein RuvA [Flammeovirga kamogawensis]MBB6460967.1 Holliday junction DNA helicase RuvA [Flammeovirga kamogawensis]QWG07540.1 Holliday junction branch migration protein RuvA [Flammeovirga kamogawensis]TRX69352.1 Holliday junction branch migration protein RuvA [Flammeovirga kamogawensis]